LADVEYLEQLAIHATNFEKVSKDLIDEATQFCIRYHRRNGITQRSNEELFSRWSTVSYVPFLDRTDKPHRFDDVKVLEILDLSGYELVNDRLAVNFAFRECGQHRGINVGGPILVTVKRNRREIRCLFHNHRIHLRPHQQKRKPESRPATRWSRAVLYISV
jgi:hypothetical protein